MPEIMLYVKKNGLELASDNQPSRCCRSETKSVTFLHSASAAAVGKRALPQYPTKPGERPNRPGCSQGQVKPPSKRTSLFRACLSACLPCSRLCTLCLVARRWP